jgi:hypothetical protein
MNNQETKQNEPGYLLGTVLIGILVALLIGALGAGVETGPAKPGLGSTLVGIYIMAWGVMFLASYYYSHKTFFFRALIWVCEHFSIPPGRKMALFYFSLAFGLGGVATLKGLGVL